MTWFLFKAPHVRGEMPIQTFREEPPTYLVELKAMEFGSIVVMDDAALAQWEKDNPKK